RSIDAQRLKEKLTDERVYWPQDSLMHDAAEHVIRQQLNAIPATQPAAKAPATPAGEKAANPAAKADQKPGLSAHADAAAPAPPGTPPAGPTQAAPARRTHRGRRPRRTRDGPARGDRHAGFRPGEPARSERRRRVTTNPGRGLFKGVDAMRFQPDGFWKIIL